MDNQQLTPQHEPKVAPTKESFQDVFATNTLLRERLEALAASERALFVVNVYDDEGKREIDLFQIYLDAMPEETRQVYNCRTCRDWLRDFGRAVRILDDGRLEAVLWHDRLPEPYRFGLAAVKAAVERRPVQGLAHWLPDQFSSDWETLKSQTGAYYHLAVKLPHGLRPYAMTKAGEDYDTLNQRVDTILYALDQYSPQVVAKAMALLGTGQLAGGHVIEGPLTNFSLLQQAVGKYEGTRRRHIAYRHSLGRSEGFFHIRQSLTGNFLDNLKPLTERAVEGACKALAEATKGEHYKRSTEAPTEAQLANAEREFGELGESVAKALERRKASMADMLEYVWRATPAAPAQPQGVFAHLKAKDAQPQVAAKHMLPGVKDISWASLRNALEGAEEIEVNLPVKGPYLQFMTQAHHDAAPIYSWDNEEQRNPVSTVAFVGGSHISAFRGTPGWTKSCACVISPHKWFGGAFSHMAYSWCFLVEGMEMIGPDKGNGLFTSDLKSNFQRHGLVIENYANLAVMHPALGVPAAGIQVVPGLEVRVHKNGAIVSYRVAAME